jgi:dTDP-4-dehydrorhamnose reductase
LGFIKSKKSYSFRNTNKNHKVQMEQRILITGANGLLGQKIQDILGREGIDYLATARSADKYQGQQTKRRAFAIMDIEDADQVQKVFKDFSPTHVLHGAAMTQVDHCELNQEDCKRANVTATQNIIEACKQEGAFLLHVSTDFIFDGKEGPLDEEATPAPVNYYGWTKLEAEQTVMESGLDWAIARTILVYGTLPDMSRSNIILWVKGSLEAGKEIKVVTDQFRTPTLAEDLAMGCFLILEKSAKGLYNIAGKELLTPYEMAMATAEYFGLDKNLIQKADAKTFSQPAKRPPKTGLAIDKAKKDLGYAPCSFQEGIATIAKQFAAAKP